MAEAQPAFGSPAWRAKYGRGGTAKAAAPAPARTTGRGRPGIAKRQPTLTSVVSGLKSAIAAEPEQADKEKLEGALSSIEEVQGKNATEEA